MMTLPTVSIVIPTFNREEVLVQTIHDLLALKHKALEILIVDQTANHTASVTEELTVLNSRNHIRWLKVTPPSIPNAMNMGALQARGEVVLFVDDDILTRSELVLEHAKRYALTTVNGVAGQVIQSWEKELNASEGSYRNGKKRDPDAFMFNSALATSVRRFIGCNVSFRRQNLIAIGGFDNNFAKVAYRYEAESAERFVSHGYHLVFEPKASLQHLKEASGGTRSYGDHLTSIKPSHCVGMYYYFLVVKNQHHRWRRFFSAPFNSFKTRFHLNKPWYIPITFISHISGMMWAVCLRIKGQKLLSDCDLSDTKKADHHTKQRSKND